MQIRTMGILSCLSLVIVVMLCGLCLIPLGTTPTPEVRYSNSDSTQQSEDIPDSKDRDDTPLTPSIPEDVTIKIVNDDSFLDIRRSIDVRLNRKVSEEVLRAIAAKLKGDSKFTRVFICYYLPGMEINAGAWATTHFDPDIKISFLGLSADEEATLSENAESDRRDLLGRWLHNEDWFAGKITLFRVNGFTWMEKVYRDGSKAEKKMVEVPSDIGRRFMVVGQTDSDYYLVLENGTLQVWSPDTDGQYVLVSTTPPNGKVSLEPKNAIGNDKSADSPDSENPVVSEIRAVNSELAALLKSLTTEKRKYVEYRLKHDARRPTIETNSQDFEKGEVGFPDRETFAVNQVVDDRNMLIFGNRIWIEGISTSGIVDDSVISLKDKLFVVSGTKRYQTALGARTVWHLTVMDSTELERTVKDIRKLQQKLSSLRNMRQWTDSTGKYSVWAEWVAFDFDRDEIQLKKVNGKVTSLPITRLSQRDQEWLRGE